MRIIGISIFRRYRHSVLCIIVSSPYYSPFYSRYVDFAIILTFAYVVCARSGYIGEYYNRRLAQQSTREHAKNRGERFSTHSPYVASAGTLF